MTDANKLTDQELIDEMLKRFIVPQWYEKDHLEQWGVREEDYDTIQEKVRESYLFCDIDSMMNELIQDLIINGDIKDTADNATEGDDDEGDDDDEELNELKNENQKLKTMLHKALKLDDDVAIGKFEEEDDETIDNLKKLNDNLRDMVHVALTQHSTAK